MTEELKDNLYTKYEPFNTTYATQNQSEQWYIGSGPDNTVHGFLRYTVVSWTFDKNDAGLFTLTVFIDTSSVNNSSNLFKNSMSNNPISRAITLVGDSAVDYFTRYCGLDADSVQQRIDDLNAR